MWVGCLLRLKGNVYDVERPSKRKEEGRTRNEYASKDDQKRIQNKKKDREGGGFPA